MTEEFEFEDEDSLPKVERPVIPASFPKWAPDGAIKWLQSVGPKHPDASAVLTHIAMLSDLRMRAVWEWHGKVVASTSDRPKPLRGDALSLLFDVERYTSLPGFPGNLSLVERTRYMAKVRDHARELLVLLSETVFNLCPIDSPPDNAEPIQEERLPKAMLGDLGNWGEDSPGRIVSYFVDGDGVYPMPWHFPESALSSLLADLVDWTYSDDGFDWGMKSSKPLERAKGKGAKVSYFTRSMFESLERKGIEIPFCHLATIANVALNLPASESVDEDAVRKQVRRYQADLRKEEASKDCPF